MDSQVNSRSVRQPVNVFVGLGDATGTPGRSRNISLTGLFLETEQRPTVGSVVDVWFVWGEDTFVSKAEVIRHAPDGIGVAFVEPDSFFIDAIAEILGVDPPSSS